MLYHGMRMNCYSGRTTRNTGAHLLRLPIVIGDILEVCLGPLVVPKKVQPNFGILFSGNGSTLLHHVRTRSLPVMHILTHAPADSYSSTTTNPA
jgi:hypothetical protein